VIRLRSLPMYKPGPKWADSQRAILGNAAAAGCWSGGLRGMFPDQPLTLDRMPVTGARSLGTEVLFSNKTLTR